jgi:hypothetical protein
MGALRRRERSGERVREVQGVSPGGKVRLTLRLDFTYQGEAHKVGRVPSAPTRPPVGRFRPGASPIRIARTMLCPHTPPLFSFSFASPRRRSVSQAHVADSSPEPREARRLRLVEVERSAKRGAAKAEGHKDALAALRMEL